MGNTYHKRGRAVQGYKVSDHPLYSTWANMKSRCANPKNPAYINYGERGISVCDEWLSFETFAEDMGMKPSSELTLERIDNDKGYNKGNCKWGTRTEQCLNRRIFTNNKTGATGVIQCGSRFIARLDFEGVRYSLGRFNKLEDALKCRDDFERAFNLDHVQAVADIPETIWGTSSTGIRGVTKSAKGFIVRKTVDGERLYLGYRTTLKAAQDLLDNHNVK